MMWARPVIQTSPGRTGRSRSIARALAEETLRYKNQLSAIEQEKEGGLEKLHRKRKETARQIEQEDSETHEDTQARHTQALETIESTYERECKTLTARWDDGLRAVSELLSAGCGIDPELVDWNSPAWSTLEVAGRILRPVALRRDEGGSDAA